LAECVDVVIVIMVRSTQSELRLFLLLVPVVLLFLCKALERVDEEVVDQKVLIISGFDWEL